MTTRKRNIYPIHRRPAVALLVVLGATLAVTATPAAAQCEGVAGAGDEYCETLPGAGGDRTAGRGADSKQAGGGLSRETERALDRAEAGALRQVESPRAARGTAGAGAESPAAGTGGPDESILPYLLGALTVALLLAALMRLRRGSTSPPDAAS